MTDDDESILLGDEGQILLSDAAIRVYADYARLPRLAAQRELLTLLCDARPVDMLDSPERWRYRDRVRGVDLSARVVRHALAGRHGHAWLLFDVVAITCRGYAPSRGGQRTR